MQAHKAHSQSIKEAVAQNDGDTTSKILSRNKGWQERAIADKRLLFSSYQDVSCQDIYCPMRATIEKIQEEIETLRAAFSAYGTCQHPNTFPGGSAPSFDVAGCPDRAQTKDKRDTSKIIAPSIQLEIFKDTSKDKASNAEPQISEDATKRKAPSVAPESFAGWFQNAKSMLDLQQQQLGAIKQDMEGNNKVVSEWITEINNRIKGIDSAQKNIYIMLFEHIESGNERQADDKTIGEKVIKRVTVNDEIQEKKDMAAKDAEVPKKSQSRLDRPDKQRTGIQRESRLPTPKTRRNASEPFSAEGRKEEVAKKKSSFVKKTKPSGSSTQVSESKGLVAGTTPRSRLSRSSSLNKSSSSVAKEGARQEVSQPPEDKRDGRRSSKKEVTKQGKEPQRAYDIREQVIVEIDDLGDQEELLRKQSQEILDRKELSGNLDFDEEYELTADEKKFLESLKSKRAKFASQLKTVDKVGHEREATKKVDVGIMTEGKHVQMSNQAQIQKLQKKVKILQEECEKLRKANNGYREQLYSNNMGGFMAEAEVRKANSKIECLSETIVLREEERTAMNQEIKDLKTKITNLNNELSRCNKDTNKLEKNNKDLKEDLEDKNAKVEALRKQLEIEVAAVRDGTESTLTTEVERLKKELKSCREERNKLKTDNKALSEEITLVKKQNLERSSVMAEIQELRHEMKSCTYEKYALEIYNNRLSGKVALIKQQLEEQIARGRKCQKENSDEQEVIKKFIDELVKATAHHSVETATIEIQAEEKLALERKIWEYERKLMKRKLRTPKELNVAEMVDPLEGSSDLEVQMWEERLDELYELKQLMEEEQQFKLNQKLMSLMTAEPSRIGSAEIVDMTSQIADMTSQNEKNEEEASKKDLKEKASLLNFELTEEVVKDLQEIIDSKSEEILVKNQKADRFLPPPRNAKLCMKDKVLIESQQNLKTDESENVDIKRCLPPRNSKITAKDKDDLIELQRNLKKLESENEDLREDICMFIAERSINNALSDLQHENESKMNKLKKEERLKESDHDAYEMKRRTDDEKCKEIGYLKEKMNIVHKELEKVKKERDEIAKKNHDDTKKMNNLLQEIHEFNLVREKFEKKSKQNEQELRDEITNLSTELDALKNKDKDSAEQITKYQDDVEFMLSELDHNHRDLKTKEENIRRISNELKEIKEERDELRKKVGELKGQIGKNNQEANLEVKKLKDKYDEAKANDLRKISNKYREIEKERDELLKKFNDQRLQSVIESGMKKTAAETQQKELIMKLNFENDDLRTNLACKENHLSVLSKELTAKNDELREMVKEIDNLRKKVEELNDKIVQNIQEESMEKTALETQKDQLIKKLKNQYEEERAEDVRRISIKYKEVEKERDELKRKDILESAMKKSAAETQQCELIKTLKNQNDDLREKLSMKEKNVSKLSEDLSEKNDELKGMRKEINDLKSKINELNDSILKNIREENMKKSGWETEKHDLIKKLKDRYEEEKAEGLLRISNELKEIKEERDELKRKVKELNNQVAKKIQEGSIQKTAWETEKDQLIEKLKSQYDNEKEKELRRVSDELSEIRTERDVLKKKVDELNDQLVKKIPEESTEKTVWEAEKDNAIRKLKYQYEEEKAEDLRRMSIRFRKLEKERDELISTLNDQRMKNVLESGMKKTAVESQQNDLIKNLKDQNDHLRKSLSTKENLLSILSKELSERNDEMRGMMKEMRNLKRTVDGLNNQIIENIREKSVEKTSGETDRNAFIAMLKNQYEEDSRRIINELNEIKEERDELKKKIDDLNSQIAKKIQDESIEKTAWETERDNVLRKLKRQYEEETAEDLRRMSIRFRKIETERDELISTLNDLRMKSILESGMKKTAVETQQNDLIKNLKEQNDHLRRKLSTKENHLSILSKELSEKNDELRGMRREVNNLNWKVEKVVENIQEESIEKAAWETERDNVLRKLKLQYEEETAEDLRRMSIRFRKLERERDELRSTLNDLRMKNILESGMKKTALETQQKDLIKNLKEQNDHLRRNLSTKENHLSILSKELSEKNDELRGMRREVNNLNWKVDELNDKVIENIQEESIEKTAWETERDNVLRKLKRQYEEETAEDLRRMSIRFRKIERERDELRSTLNDLRMKNILESGMKKTAVESQQNDLIKNLKEQNDHLLRNLSTKENHLSILSKELSEKNDELLGMRREVNDLKWKVDELNDKVVENIQEESIEKTAWETQTDNVKKLKDEYEEEMAADLRRIRIKYRKIEKERDELKRKVNDLRSKNISEAGMTKTTAETQENDFIKDLYEQNCHLQKDLATKENHLTMLSKELSERSDELTGMRREMNNLRRKVDELNDKIVQNIQEGSMEKTAWETEKDDVIRKLTAQYEEEKAEDLLRMSIRFRKIERERDELRSTLNDLRMKNILESGMKKSDVETQQNDLIKSLKEQNDHLRKSLSTKENHLSILSKELSERNDELRRMRREVRNLKMKVDGLNEKVVENIQGESMEKTARETERDNVMNRLENDYEKEMAEDLRKLSMKYREIEKERDELKRKVNDQRSRNISEADMTKTTAEIQQNDFIKDLHEQNCHLQKDLATKENNLKMLSKELSERNHELRGMRREMNNMRRKVDELNDKIVQSIPGESMEKTASETERYDSVGKLKNVHEKEKENDLHRMSNELREIKEERDELKKKVNELNDQIRKSIQEADMEKTAWWKEKHDFARKLKDQYDVEKTEALSKISNELNEMKEERDILKKKVSELNNQIGKDIQEANMEKTAWKNEKHDFARKLKDQYDVEKTEALSKISNELNEMKEERDILKKKVSELNNQIGKNIREANIETAIAETQKDDVIKNLRDQSDNIRKNLEMKEQHWSRLSKELSARTDEHVNDGEREKDFYRIGQELKQLEEECREMTSEVKHLCHIVSKYITDVSIARSLVQSGVDSSEAECDQSRPGSAKSNDTSMKHDNPPVKEKTNLEWPKIIVTQSSHSKLHPADNIADCDPVLTNDMKSLTDLLLENEGSMERLRKSSHSDLSRKPLAISPTEILPQATNEVLPENETSKVMRDSTCTDGHSDSLISRSVAPSTEKFARASNEVTFAESNDYEVGFAEVQSGRSIDCPTWTGFAEMVSVVVSFLIEDY